MHKHLEAAAVFLADEQQEWDVHFERGGEQLGGAGGGMEEMLSKAMGGGLGGAAAAAGGAAADEPMEVHLHDDNATPNQM